MRCIHQLKLFLVWIIKTIKNNEHSRLLFKRIRRRHRIHVLLFDVIKQSYIVNDG